MSGYPPWRTIPVSREGASPAPVRPVEPSFGIGPAGALTTDEVLRELGVKRETGLSSDEVARRRARYGPNAVSSHRARLLPVLWHQLRSPLLVLLMVAAVASASGRI